MVMAALTTALCVAFSPKGALRARAPAIRMGVMPQIAVGDALPDADVQLATDDAKSGFAVGDTRKISEVMGDGLSVLLGMPGAFTPTCTDQHLPSYYTSANALTNLGVSRVHVLTTNDKWVNAAWQSSMSECMLSDAPDSTGIVNMLADPRGDLLESLGMISYLGPELVSASDGTPLPSPLAHLAVSRSPWQGVRSKRFALLVEEGVVRHVAVDSGYETLEETSADALLKSDYIAARKERVAEEAVAAIGAEIYGLSAADALELLESSRQSLLESFVDAEEVEQAVAVVSKAAAIAERIDDAEKAIAAKLYTMGAVEAYQYLSSAAATTPLLAAGVPAAQIKAATAIVYAAALKIDPQLKKAGGGMGDGSDEKALVGGLIGAVVVGLVAYIMQ